MSDEPLPFDPDIEVVTLPNGLTCWLRSHASPPGKTELWMRIRTGSGHEEEQLGLAHFLEHMAFANTVHYPSGSMVASLEALGIRFGKDINAWTGWNETIYALSLPDSHEKILDQALRCLSDIAFGILLLPEEIDRERRVILEEIRLKEGPSSRVRQEILEALFPGSPFSREQPLGGAEGVRKVTEKRLQSFYEAWYNPGNTTLLAVGDSEPGVLQDHILTHFDGWQAGGPPASSVPIEVPLYNGARAVIITDTERADARVNAFFIMPLRSMRVMGDLRNRLIEDLAWWILNRRMQRQIRAGNASFQSAGIGSQPLFDACTLIRVHAGGPPEKTEDILHGLLIEIKRAREHGVSVGELDFACLCKTDRKIIENSFRSSWDLIKEMKNAAGANSIPMSGGQLHGLQKTLFPSIRITEIQSFFCKHLSPDRLRLVVLFPEHEKTARPEPAQVLEWIRAVAVQEVALPAETTPILSSLVQVKRRGAILVRSEDTELQIVSATLDNGVRIHLREMNDRKGFVRIRAVLAGGRIQEEAETRGLTSAALQAFDHPASERFPSTDLHDLIETRQIEVKGRVMEDACELVFHTSNRNLKVCFQLAHLLLTEPQLEEQMLTRWRMVLLQHLEEQRHDVDAQARQLFWQELTHGNPRFLSPTRDRVNTIHREAAQQWLGSIVHHAPLEVSIVGDEACSHTLELAVSYFGALSLRPRNDSVLSEKRKILCREGPLVRKMEVPCKTAYARIFLGWRTAPWGEVHKRRMFHLASLILNQRLRREIRERRGLTYSTYCAMNASKAYPALSWLGASFTTAPEHTDEAAEVTRALIKDFAWNGPTQDELQTARHQMTHTVQQTQSQSAYWSHMLAELDYHHSSLNDLKNVLHAYQTYTRENLMATVRPFIVESNRFQFIAIPGK